MEYAKRTGQYSRGFQFEEIIESDRSVNELMAEIDRLRALVNTQSEQIAELESRVDPYSQDGKAICNSYL